MPQINYENRTEFCQRETHRTQKFGNLLSDTFQGEISDNEDGTWSGWIMNLSRVGESEYRFDFVSKIAAKRWVNKNLRKHFKRE